MDYYSLFAWYHHLWGEPPSGSNMNVHFTIQWFSNHDNRCIVHFDGTGGLFTFDGVVSVDTYDLPLSDLESESRSESGVASRKGTRANF